jgi:hypothetical protein
MMVVWIVMVIDDVLDGGVAVIVLDIDACDDCVMFF